MSKRLVDSTNAKNRILYYKGQRYNCETFQQAIPKESFKEVTVGINGQERTRPRLVIVTSFSVTGETC